MIALSCPRHDRFRLPAAEHRVPRTARHLLRGGPAQPSRTWPRRELVALPSFVRRPGRGRRTAGPTSGFVAIENSIEGTVNANLDALVFERELLIVGEVILPSSRTCWHRPVRAWPT